MTKLARRIIPLALMLGIGATLPSPAAARSSCNDDYMWCLNDSYDTTGWDRLAADLDCFAENLKCKLKFKFF